MACSDPYTRRCASGGCALRRLSATALTLPGDAGSLEGRPTSRSWRKSSERIADARPARIRTAALDTGPIRLCIAGSLEYGRHNSPYARQPCMTRRPPPPRASGIGPGATSASPPATAPSRPCRCRHSRRCGSMASCSPCCCRRTARGSNQVDSHRGMQGFAATGTTACRPMRPPPQSAAGRRPSTMRSSVSRGNQRPCSMTPRGSASAARSCSGLSASNRRSARRPGATCPNSRS
jgi:hypothetical protein